MKIPWERQKISKGDVKIKINNPVKKLVVRRVTHK